jgi:hypothetical protein
MKYKVYMIGAVTAILLISVSAYYVLVVKPRAEADAKVAAATQLVTTNMDWTSMMELWHLLNRPMRWLDDNDPEPYKGVALLVKKWLSEEGYRCQQPVKIIGHGPSPRGRYGQFICAVDGSELEYRVEINTDGSYSVWPW